MSQENVDLVRRALEAFPRGDMDEMLSYLDPELEWHSAIVGGAEGNVYRGHEGFRRWFADSFESFEELSNEWSEFRDLGDRVLAFGAGPGTRARDWGRGRLPNGLGLHGKARKGGESRGLPESRQGSRSRRAFGVDAATGLGESWVGTLTCV